MREISKTISVSVDDRPMDFRLTKLDAFSGVSLLRILARLPEQPLPDVISTRAEGRAEKSRFPAFLLFSSLSDADLRSFMTACLEHTEVRLPAGWMPVMTRGEWSYPELEHDAAVCLKLTIEEVLWTLEGFFAGGVPASRPGTPDS